ncbi:MAG: hypothetical protein NC397_03870 [Clostridium sp.]|nr:hypothetical protein [Clostridium sp.]
MKKTLSLILSIVMLLSITAGIDLSAYAASGSSSIESISYTPVKPIEYVENVGGYWTDEGTYCYYIEAENVGDMLTVYYSDGTSVDYYYVEDDDNWLWGWIDSNGEELDGYLDYDMGHQYDVPWTLGSDNYFTVDYMGVQTQVPVTIIESTVESISYTPVKPVELIENVGGFELDNGGYYYFCDIEIGDTLTVYYKDGTSNVYCCDINEYYDITWLDAEGNVLPGYVEYDDNQWAEYWTIGGDNYFTIEYMGVTTQVPVTIVESPVLSVFYKPATDIKYSEYDETVGCWDYDAYFNECFYYDIYPSVDDKLTVNYKDGTSAEYTFLIDGYWADSEGQMLDFSYFNIASDQYENPWTVGSDNYFTVEFMGVPSQPIPVTIVKHNHKWSSKVTKQATCKATGVKTYTCTLCGQKKTETIAKKSHTYKTYTTKATTSKNGSVVTKCSVCGTKKSSTTIYYPKTITLSTTSYTYDGKAKKPSVTVKDSKGKKISASNYTVSYASGRKNVGQYTVTIKFKGNYSGTVKKTFTIKPKSTSLSSVSAGSKKFTVKWKKQTTQTTGYQIQYSTDKNFKKNNKTVTVSKNSTTSKSISKLSGKKKYYVRIRTYKTVKVNGKSTKIYSNWSSAKSVTTKK